MTYLFRLLHMAHHDWTTTVMNLLPTPTRRHPSSVTASLCVCVCVASPPLLFLRPVLYYCMSNQLASPHE